MLPGKSESDEKKKRELGFALIVQNEYPLLFPSTSALTA
jgi:hypothetical protein